MRLDQLPMTTLKCRSSHNPNMETQESEIGVSSVHKSRVSCDGDEDCQRILCLDGGGMKVKSNKLSCMLTAVACMHSRTSKGGCGTIPYLIAACVHTEILHGELNGLVIMLIATD